jgi:hypothetical protein
LILFAGLLLINVAAQGYVMQPFRSTTFNQTSPGFPANFVPVGTGQDSCEPHALNHGDGMPRLVGSNR